MEVTQLPPLPPETVLYKDEQVADRLMLASRRLAELKGLACTQQSLAPGFDHFKKG